jgi:hypothetical protein
MTNKPKRIGTDGEVRVRDYLISRGYRYAKRIVQEGALDIGDVYPGDGIPVTIQVKSGKSATPGIPGNLSAALAQAENAGNPMGVLWSKRMGTQDPGRWIVSMSGEQFVTLMSQVYPPPN